MNVPEILRQAGLKKKENKKFVLKLHTKKAMIKQIDDIVHEIHDEVFEKIDCLQCANCCKTTSPIFRDVDVSRIAKKFKMTSGEFENRYLRMDDENDWVLQESPCAFLNEDNSCFIYDVRPQVFYNDLAILYSTYQRILILVYPIRHIFYAFPCF